MKTLSTIIIIFFLTLISLVICQPESEDDGSKGDKYSILEKEWCGDDDCYDILGVSQASEFREIKQRYNNLSLLLHPDKNPNQTKKDAARYVRINKAYEILSSKRNDYDRYLHVKKSMDSPIENPFFVLLILYCLLVYVVLLYQKQQQSRRKKAILNEPKVVRYYWEQKQIDLTGKKKIKSPRKGKSKKKSKNKSNTGLTPSQIQEQMEINEYNEIIQKCNLMVPGWKNQDPTYKQAMIDVPKSIFNIIKQLYGQLSWIVKYKILKQEYSDDDRVLLCRNHYKKTEIEWNAMPKADQEKLLNKPGIWRKKNVNSKKSKKNK